MTAYIEEGRAILGIELGSTRIKGVLIDDSGACLATGAHSWENQYVEGFWTYDQEAIWAGLQACCRDLASQVYARYGVHLSRLAGIGISGMMHGYMPFGAEGNLLVPFRTWRNTTTGEAADSLTREFQFNIPQRWSIAHLYQAILQGEAHVPMIEYMTTVAGYVHWQLTGERVLGIGEASGMFPIDSTAMAYDRRMMAQFDALLAQREITWTLADIMPRVLLAGQPAGTLTAEGAMLLDPTGRLQAGIPLCPPEGDAGTGMTATNAVAVRTGNVSAGTSVFAMVVLEKELSKVYPEIDLVTTPAGRPVAMVHCNNCTNEINAWAGLFREVVELFGSAVDTDTLYARLFEHAVKGEPDGGGLMLYNNLSGEPVTGFDEGRPLFVRTPQSRFTLPNLMRTQLYASVATLAIGMELLRAEDVHIDRLMGHGGFFKSAEIARSVMAAATRSKVATTSTAGEGGPWGMALLAAYMLAGDSADTLERFLATRIFHETVMEESAPYAGTVQGFETFLAQYRQGLAVERAAIDHIKG